MTRNEFIYECESRLISPELAVENEKIREALGFLRDELVKELLDSEF